MLKVGTDCSGIEAPIEALKQLNIPYEHVFSSEIDKYCIKSIKANYNPKIIFGDKDGTFKNGDIRERDMNDVPDIDLYVCGFPCQPFSIAGERKGMNDKRGNVFYSCLEVIKIKQPKYFILENVKGLKSHDKGRTFNIIWNELLTLREIGYFIDWKILNTRDYGIPQNRERIFIIGSKEGEIIWPEKKEMDNLTNYIDWEDNNTESIPNRIVKSNFLNKIPNNSLIVDFSFYGTTNFPLSYAICPCITRKSELWIVKKNRRINVKELLKLQNFNNSFKKVVSKTQFIKQVGNSISVNVLKNIFNLLIEK